MNETTKEAVIHATAAMRTIMGGVGDASDRSEHIVSAVISATERLSLADTAETIDCIVFDLLNWSAVFREDIANGEV